jgi:hypothetical protein
MLPLFEVVVMVVVEPVLESETVEEGRRPGVIRFLRMLLLMVSVVCRSSQV